MMPCLVNGVSVCQRAQVKTTGADTRLRSLARLCQEAGDDGENAALIAPVSDSLFLWKRFVSSIAFEKEKWKAATPFQLFSVTIEAADAPPICLLVCKAFLQYIVSWMKTRTSGAACCDTTWKLNSADWGLFTFAGMATHLVPRDGHRRCMALPFSMTFGPKEDTPTLYWSIKNTLAFYEKHCGVILAPFLSVIMWDATLAGAAAHREALPRTDYARDLHHQISKAKETAPLKCQGDAETKAVAVWLVVDSLSFSAFNLWTLDL